ncbi:protein ENL [Bombyx mori]|uniref:YEATS domain-containing protein n=1 Tax=Bombyx mori TaxID=7091 RepID=A0A8R2AJJ6_BOMMO|nr:protein ENL [Bombyx mori]
MSPIRVNFEIGHEATLKPKKTPDGFTHDWEVFVRGQEGVDISHFINKVVFHLHHTFLKPRRVVKDPPFSIKESGYAGFTLPIEIYLKNKDEPKKITFSYNLTLQQNGFLKDRYIFKNPSDEFSKKLLKGGGIPCTNSELYTNPDQESRSRDSFTDEKHLVSKPKLSSENNKKHKTKEHKDDVPMRNSSFVNLFGPPIHKPAKVSPDPKKIEKVTPPIKLEKKDKERSSSEKKSKHEHKESKIEKNKTKDEREKNRPDKVKTPSKDQEKIKEKASKRPSDRPASPDAVKKRCLSPIGRSTSSPLRANSVASNKEEYKPARQNLELLDHKKPRPDEKHEMKAEKEKKKKEKKSHDRDKERKERKDHKKESHRSKESPKEIPKEKELPHKVKDIIKEKESPPIKEKQARPEKTINKFSIENLRKTPPPEIDERSETPKKDKNETERKHKHKKKDKKRDESKEKHKDSSKEKRHKHEKTRETPTEKVIHRITPIPKERLLPEPTSPISIDTASQCSSKSGVAKPMLLEGEEINSSQSDSENSVICEDDEPKIVKIEPPSPEIVKQEPSPEPEPQPEPEPEPEVKPDPQPLAEVPPPPHKEKSKKHKDKSKKEEKRRKRKAAEEEVERKIPNIPESGPSYNETEWGESSGSTSMETKVQDNGVSSSLGEDAELGDISPDYMEQLRDLQQRIMKIKNNEDLERVVNLIAETGRYEVTTQTFDFDLCLLDRSTVQQLIQLVGC